MKDWEDVLCIYDQMVKMYKIICNNYMYEPFLECMNL